MWLIIVLTLLLPVNALAQKTTAIEYQDYQLHNARTATADGPSVPVDRSNTVTFDVTITGTADLTFRVAGAGALGWNALNCTASDSSTPVTSASASGVYTCNVAGANAVSARVNTCTSCNVSVVARKTTAILGNGGAGGGGGTAGWPSVTTDKDINNADGTANAIGILGASGDGTFIYLDATKGPQIVNKCSGVLNGCDYYRELAAGKKVGFKNSAGTIGFEHSEATNSITAMTVDAETSGVTITSKKYKWLAGAGCNGASASTIWDLPSTNPAVAVCRTGTNTTKGVLEFADGANALTAQLTEFLVEDWIGAIDATVVWQSGSTSTNNVVWQLAIACAGDTDSDDPAFTDDAFTADANKATANQYNLTAVNTITTTGTCAANDIMHIRVKRDPANASDTLAATAQLVGVYLKLREAQ